jgi:hypothetical protein
MDSQRRGVAHLGLPKAHTRKRNVIIPRVSTAVAASAQVITT